MEIARTHSFVQDLSSREFNGFGVRKRPRFSADISLRLKEIGALAVDHDGDQTLPLAVSFCKVWIWNSQNNSCSSSKRPTSSNRKRIMGMPTIEQAKDSDSSDSPYFDRASAAPSNSNAMDM